MSSEKRIEKFLKRIDVVPDAVRKQERLTALLESRDQSQTITSDTSRPTIRSILMNRHAWKVAASLIGVVTLIGVIGILQNGNQAAYAFEQTVAAMMDKQSFHIMTYWATPTDRDDEYWTEFDEFGKVIRYRRLERFDRFGMPDRSPIETIWESGVRYDYELEDPNEPGILLVTRTEQVADMDDLEEFNPETTLETLLSDLNGQIESGRVTVTYGDSLTSEGYISIEVIRNSDQWRDVLLVDPETKFLVRMDYYRLYPTDEDLANDDNDKPYLVGNYKYLKGIEVLEYNQSIDPNVFIPDFPEDTIVIDQLDREVGMAQGDLTNEEVAYAIVMQAMEAWAAADYKTAGMLFGGAPQEYFTMHRNSQKPLGEITYDEIEKLRWYEPKYRINCKYDSELSVTRTRGMPFNVAMVPGQPGRWFITP